MHPYINLKPRLDNVPIRLTLIILGCQFVFHTVGEMIMNDIINKKSSTKLPRDVRRPADLKYVISPDEGKVKHFIPHSTCTSYDTYH